METHETNAADDPSPRRQFSLRTLLAVMTGFAFFLGMAKSIPSESWVGAGLVFAVIIGLGIALYDGCKKPPL